MIGLLSRDDAREIIGLLRRQQREFWEQSWKYKQIDDLIAKLEATMLRGRKAPERAMTSSGVTER